MASEDRMKKIASSDSDINILLLGETGVGKSTFINSFANYLQYDTLDAAYNGDLICLIPAKFNIPDEDFEERTIQIGEDENEDQCVGNSSTQATRSYVFKVENKNQIIRLIDTPGIGDARGIEQDNINFENILMYLSQFKYLHAICFLLKPNISRLNAYFKFCIMHLLSRLERSAVHNIVFTFTNSRSTLYRPGETLPVLKKVLAEVQQNPPNVKVPCSKTNMFCMDNEAFRFLVALKHDIHFSEKEMENFSQSWEISAQTCKDLICYVAGEKKDALLRPHSIQGTLSVNQARRVITNLCKPLADISDNIQDNLMVLKRHQDHIESDNLSIADLQKKLYVPVISLRQIDLQQPVTVCTAKKCSEVYTVAELTKYHYKQRCHNPCYLRNVPREIIGSPELLGCTAMAGTTQCNQCRCDFKTHMHVWYETETFEDQQQNEAVISKITSTTDQIEAKKKLIAELEQRKKEYENEMDIITASMAKFSHFIKKHSIAIYNDAYEDYIDYLINRETNLGPDMNSDFINRHQDLKKAYQQEKQLLERAINYPGSVEEVTADVIQFTVQDLYNLKHSGTMIEKLHKKQEDMHSKSQMQTTEYYHPKPISEERMRSQNIIDELELRMVKDAIEAGDFAGLMNRLRELNINEKTKKRVINMDIGRLLNLVASI